MNALISHTFPKTLPSLLLAYSFCVYLPVVSVIGAILFEVSQSPEITFSRLHRIFKIPNELY